MSDTEQEVNFIVGADSETLQECIERACRALEGLGEGEPEPTEIKRCVAEPLKTNTAAFKPDFTRFIDEVRTKKQTLIVQRNNRDLCAVVPLEVLELIRGK